MGIVEKVKKFVEEECKKPSSKYGFDPFHSHFFHVAKYAEQLADEFECDKEVVLISAWLHDIGSIIHGRENHHETGAKIAEEKLKELNYPSEKIEKVKKCIMNHRGSVNNERKSIEEKIIAEADVMSAFDNIGGLFKAAFVYENKSQEEGKHSVRQKLKRKRNQLHFKKTKEIIKPKYEAAMLLLE